MDSPIVTILLAVFASSGVWSVITLLIQWKLNRKNSIDDEQRKMNKMVMGLGHDRITFLGMAYINKGYITKDEYEDLVTYLYAPYEALGGNGTAKLIIDRVGKLPMIANKSETADINSKFIYSEQNR
jgi:hypothetical protein